MINKNIGWLIAHYDAHSKLFGLVGDNEWLCDGDMVEIDEIRLIKGE